MGGFVLKVNEPGASLPGVMEGNHARLESMDDLLKRVTSEPEKFGGRPCIRGLRIRVVDVLDLLAAGLSHDEILKELPDLEAEDIRAALAFAGKRVDHPLIAAE